MRLFQLSSKKFTGHVTLLYDKFDKLISASFENAELSVSQTRGLLYALPVEIVEMEALLERFPQARLVEGSFHITFEAFWEKYGKKINQMRCIPLWNKLVPADVVGAFYGVDPYRAYCKRENRKLADPETYLKNRYWENEY